MYHSVIISYGHLLKQTFIAILKTGISFFHKKLFYDFQDSLKMRLCHSSVELDKNTYNNED